MPAPLVGIAAVLPAVGAIVMSPEVVEHGELKVAGDLIECITVLGSRVRKSGAWMSAMRDLGIEIGHDKKLVDRQGA